MCSLRHRIFPPHFLLKWSKEAFFLLMDRGYCIPSLLAGRKLSDEVLKSEFLNESRDDLVEHEAFIELKEKEAADNLRRTVAIVSSDLQEVAKLHPFINKQQGLDSNKDGFPSSGFRKRIKIVDTSNSIEPEHQENTIVKSSQLMKNFKKL
ncbi:hypothetical protein Hanom_Chr09g00856251 [Helianthus anomalus]